MADDEPEPTGAPDERRASRLALALDVDDLVAALRLARELRAVVRRGEGRPRAVQRGRARGDRAACVDLGFDVFVDLKLHDIPTTVGRAARVLGALGARYLTVHARGGVTMLRAGVEGLREGAAAGGPRASRWRWPSPSSRATPRRRPTSCASGSTTGRRGRLRGHRVRRGRPRRGPPARAARCSWSSRASGPRARPPTTRPGWPRPAEARRRRRRPARHRPAGDRGPTTRSPPPGRWWRRWRDRAARRRSVATRA